MFLGRSISCDMARNLLWPWGLFALVYIMPLPSTCIRIGSIRQRLRRAAVDSTYFTNHSERFHHHLVSDIRQISSLKSSATTRTLPGFLPSTMTSPTSAMGSTVFQWGSHDDCTPEIQELYQGNKAYMMNMSETSPGLLQSLANDGQSAFSSFPYFQNIDLTFSALRFIRAPVYGTQLFG